MPVQSRSGPRRLYASYFSLLLLFAITVTYHAGTATAVLGTPLDGNEHVREPFDLDGQKMALFLVRPEAGGAGIKDGDLLTAIQGQPVRGITVSIRSCGCAHCRSGRSWWSRYESWKPNPPARSARCLQPASPIERSNLLGENGSTSQKTEKCYITHCHQKYAILSKRHFLSWV